MKRLARLKHLGEVEAFFELEKHVCFCRLVVARFRYIFSWGADIFEKLLACVALVRIRLFLLESYVRGPARAEDS